MKSDPNDLLDKHAELVHSEGRKVVSHVQRQAGEWIINTVMIDGIDVPFRYKRKRAYRDLTGALVNLTYRPEVEIVAGMRLETMKVVRIKRT